MISNQILQNTIEGLKAIGRTELCVVDSEGKMLAETTPDLSKRAGTALEFAKSPADSQEVAGNQYFKIYDEQQLEYILIAMGSGENVYISTRSRLSKRRFLIKLSLSNLSLYAISRF